MKKLKFYQSGICYGNIYFQNKQILHEKLNVFTNELEPLKVLDEESKAYYFSILKINLSEIEAQWGNYETTLSSTESNIVKMGTGAEYEKLDDHTWVERNRKFPMDLIWAENRLVGFQFISRENCAILIEEDKEDYTILKKWKEQYEEEQLYGLEGKKTYEVKMRDGISLATDVFLPKEVGQAVPTILIRTPYGRQMNQIAYYKYVQRGYAVVIQDVRGRNDSQGDWKPCMCEVEDGDDTLNWIGAQQWSNQKVGMIGASYLGYVQWAAAASGNPYLKALVSIVTSGSPFVDIPRRGGAFVSGMLAWAFAVSEQKFSPEKMIRDDWDTVLNIRPLQQLCQKSLGYDVPFIKEWMDNYDYNQYWGKMNWHSKKDKIKVPALIVSGWFDDNGMGTTEALDVVKDFQKGNRKVILGPWMHNANTTRDIHQVAFGNNALRPDLDYHFFSWFDKQLKEKNNGYEKTAPVEYYTTGSNQWKTAENWPIPDCKYKNLYLNCNSALTFEKPEESGQDTYIYDPEDPAPHLIDMSENELEVPENYKDVEQRADVLCYTSEILTEPITITGDLAVEFYASSSARDTDWVVRVTDVDECGNSIKLVDGILSARYRNSFYQSEFMEEGEVYQFKIQTTKMSNTFQVGHRLRFTITSSAKNFIFPNSNTEKGYNSTKYEKARQQIYFGGNYLSKIILPVE